jgi:hypothetical protein
MAPGSPPVPVAENKDTQPFLSLRVGWFDGTVRYHGGSFSGCPGSPYACLHRCWVHLVSGGWGSQRRHAVIAVRASAVFGGVVDGVPAPGARGTVAVVISVTAAGASGSRFGDLSPLGATP